MILDERGEFADATALNTGAPARFLLGDVIDLGPEARDMGAGEDVYFVVQTVAAVTSAGAATVDFQLVSDAQAAIAVDGTATVHLSSGPLSLAQLGANRTVFSASLGQGKLYERFLGVLQITGTAALTGGSVNAFLTHDVAAWRAYNDNVA